jgi:TATA-box binding protein (TBP) (component of TFIID and TFIIIB)
MGVDEEWQMFLKDETVSFSENIPENDEQTTTVSDAEQTIDVPTCEELSISTKTKVLYLNTIVDIENIFWSIPVIPYWKPTGGVLKKQIKIVSHNKEELELYQSKLVGIPYYIEHILKQVDNPNSKKIKFKDERKLTVGISKKDIMNARGKVKNAFYNCFALIVRFQYRSEYKEIHVKVFNTGKMEIPGVLNNEILDIIKEKVLTILQSHIEQKIYYVDTEKDDNVLINSNFNCGYYIHREKLHAILKSTKYNIETAYDPCSYPGVKCKFYFNNELGFDNKIQPGVISKEDRTMKLSELCDSSKYTEVSFMVFRTGSCLIVGNCNEKVLMFVYDFIKQLLHDEYVNIRVLNADTNVKIKTKKVRKKMVQMTKGYMNNLRSNHPPCSSDK